MSVGHVGFGNILGVFRATYFKALGKLGATAGASLVGGTISGAPDSGGPFDAGDIVADHTGAIWVCTANGSPGSWVKVGITAGAMVWIGEWSAGISYVLNNVVTRQGALYIAAIGSTGVDPVTGVNGGQSFTGNGSNSGTPFNIGSNVGTSQTIGGFWFKYDTVPVSTVALLDFFDTGSNYYRIVQKTDQHVYLEVNVPGVGISSGSLDLCASTPSVGTWYWVSFGSDCPGGAVNIMGSVSPVGVQNGDRSTGFSHGTATVGGNWTLSIGTAASTGSYSNVPSDTYIADIRIGTGNSSSGPFTRSNPIANPTQGTAQMRIPVSESFGAQSVLHDSINGYNLTGTFTVQGDKWNLLSSS